MFYSYSKKFLPTIFKAPFTSLAKRFFSELSFPLKDPVDQIITLTMKILGPNIHVEQNIQNLENIMTQTAVFANKNCPKAAVLLYKGYPFKLIYEGLPNFSWHNNYADYGIKMITTTITILVKPGKILLYETVEKFADKILYNLKDLTVNYKEYFIEAEIDDGSITLEKFFDG